MWHLLKFLVPLTFFFLPLSDNVGAQEGFQGVGPVLDDLRSKEKLLFNEVEELNEAGLGALRTVILSCDGERWNNIKTRCIYSIRSLELDFLENKSVIGNFLTFFITFSNLEKLAESGSSTLTDLSQLDDGTIDEEELEKITKSQQTVSVYRNAASYAFRSVVDAYKNAR